jgi:hypothetical protein
VQVIDFERIFAFNAVPEGTEQRMKSLVEDHVSSDRPGFLTN